MKADVEVIDKVREVVMVLSYLSNNTKDEGLSFILDACVADLAKAFLGSDSE